MVMVVGRNAALDLRDHIHIMYPPDTRSVVRR